MKDQAKKPRLRPSQAQLEKAYGRDITSWEVGMTIAELEGQRGELRTVNIGNALVSGGQGRPDYNPTPSHRNALARLLTSVAWTVTGLAVCGGVAWIGYRLAWAVMG